MAGLGALTPDLMLFCVSHFVFRTRRTRAQSEPSFTAERLELGRFPLRVVPDLSRIRFYVHTQGSLARCLTYFWVGKVVGEGGLEQSCNFIADATSPD